MCLLWLDSLLEGGAPPHTPTLGYRYKTHRLDLSESTSISHSFGAREVQGQGDSRFPHQYHHFTLPTPTPIACHVKGQQNP